eukprot:Blabericola_migrator_1__8734@NODE_45_length_16846_cov_82_345015_g41_i0_p4_GENE_NODE_45_length_16846_cov_82_345015_g41_i0NODE_45_length_16846_cov_82_345015_g41_i0_p4_ORF_typecomplete_len387_score57_89EXS/PF03124_14/2_1e33_NODE_45_length_16846_cov_82_345015_g41_i039915151
MSRYTRAEAGQGRYVHLGNMGKYLISMTVVILTSIHWNEFDISIYAQKLIWVFLYLCASLYSMVWDFVFDWGLIPDADNLLRSEDQMMYPDWIYYAISVLNLAGRLTWALTLIPVSLVSDQIVTNAIILLFVGTMEIVRRAAWMMIRLENEHLTNSSMYRAMLWVPKLRVDDEETEDLVKDRAADEETWIRCAKKQLPKFTPLEQLEESLLQSIETSSNGACPSIPDTDPPRRKNTATKILIRASSPSGFGLATVAARARQQLTLRRRTQTQGAIITHHNPQPRRRSLSLAPSHKSYRTKAETLLCVDPLEKKSRPTSPTCRLVAASPPISETYICTASPSSAVRRVKCEPAEDVTCVDVSIPPTLPSITISPVHVYDYNDSNVSL